MTSKIYVGGLPFSTTDQELKGLFDEYGTVESARVITAIMQQRLTNPIASLSRLYLVGAPEAWPR